MPTGTSYPATSGTASLSLIHELRDIRTSLFKTHRCHEKSFLLKFDQDRRACLRWLFEAKKRFGLCVLNYMVTSNHIRLLVKDTSDDVIPQSMQLIAGRTAQEYNQRKSRNAALGQQMLRRDESWSRSLAVGSQAFVEKVRAELGIKARFRAEFETGDAYTLREASGAYGAMSGGDSRSPGPLNERDWRNL